MRLRITNYLLLFAAFVAVYFAFNRGEKQVIFHGDALGYYMYLPASAIYGELKTLNIHPKGEVAFNVPGYISEMQAHRNKEGYITNQYTYGVALMEVPFFLAAHLLETIKGDNLNGFSETYSNFIKASSLIYSFLGLMLVFSVLRRYFSRVHAIVAIVLLFWGTNLFWFTIYQAGMAHVPMFFLYSLLIYVVVKLHERPSAGLFIAAGFICGLITITRPSDILCLLIPLLYNVYNKETIRLKATLIKQNPVNVIFFALSFIVPIIPQLLYWKATSGHYLFYSYGDQGFSWANPKIIEGLFYFTNGWLPYCPIMFFAIAGLVFYRSIKKWAWCLWLILPAYIYVIYSWYCYNYINGLGSRPMIHMYPLLAIPLAAFIQFVARKGLALQIAIVLLATFFVSVNLCFSLQKKKRILNSEESNMAFNIGMLYRLHLTYRDLVVNDIAEWQPGDNEATKITTLRCLDFDDSISNHFIRDTRPGSKYLFQMGDMEYSLGISVIYNSSEFAGARWFKCSGRFMYPQCPGYSKHLLVLDISGKLWKGCKIDNKIAPDKEDLTLENCTTDKWGHVYFYAKVPAGMKNGDEIKMYVANGAKVDLYLDDLCLEIYK